VLLFLFRCGGQKMLLLLPPWPLSMSCSGLPQANEVIMVTTC
jgi:hypothetical protein